MIVLLGTKNPGKIEELEELLADVPAAEFLSFSDRPFSDVEESGETFKANARLKAKTISQETRLAVLADDSGLEVDALGGAPGVRSARFAGEPADHAANNTLLLRKMSGQANRRARFVTVACLHLPNGQHFVTRGTLLGTIGSSAKGSGGFGYDPLFVPHGHNRTLAQLSLDEKNRISHRRQAIVRMKKILVQLANEDCGNRAAR